MKRLAEIPLLFQPGERWSYSYTVDVQAAALEKITGTTLGAYLDANVFKPLGMNDTAFFISEEDYKNRLATVFLEVLVLEGPLTIRDAYASDDFAAGYVGFYVCNGAIIAQEFSDAAADRAASEVLRRVFSWSHHRATQCGWHRCGWGQHPLCDPARTAGVAQTFLPAIILSGQAATARS